MKENIFKWFQRYCGYCMAGIQENKPECAYENGSFDTRNMALCKVDNCIPLKHFPTAQIKSSERME
jgi:hypothetical protein